ncbi:MAG: metallophosphoesterase [Sediminibacterium sp.]
MRIQFCSDLHLEFEENKRFIRENPLIPSGEILVLGGDICLFKTMDRHRDFFRYLSEHFEAIYWIPGNHEYYYAGYTDRWNSFCESIFDNVFLLNNKTVVYNNTRLIFATLWSHINPRKRWEMESKVNDFRLIEYFNNRLSVPGFNQLHA